MKSNKQQVASNRLLINLHQKLFFVLILLLPSQLGLHFWPPFASVFGIRVDYLSPTIYLTDILVAGIIIGWVLDEWINRQMSKRSLAFQAKWIKNIIYTPFIYFSIYLFITSLFIAQNQGVAIYKLIKFIEFFLLGFYVYKTKPLNIIHYPLAVAVLYSSIIAWMQFLLGRTLGGPLWWFGERTFDRATAGIALTSINGPASQGGQDFLRPYATFPHPNVLAGFLLIGIIWMGGLMGGRRTKENKISIHPIIYSSIYLFSISTLVITFSQSAWFAGLIILGFTSFRIFSRKVFWIIFAAVVIFSLSLPFYNSTGLPPEILQRIELAKAAREMFFDYPITGAGLGNFINKLTEYSNIPKVSWQLQPVHNIFWLVLAETGIIGFGFFLWFLGKLLSTYPFTYSPVYLSFLAILLTGIFDHYWFTLQQGQLLATIVFALSFAGKNK